MNEKETDGKEVPLKVEWNIDFDDFFVPKKTSDGGMIKKKVRCTQCWGRVEGQSNFEDGSKSGFSGIRCRNCGYTLLNKKACEEWKSMMLSTPVSSFLDILGKQMPPHKGAFIIKQIKTEAPQTLKELKATEKPDKQRKWKIDYFTRHEFPLGKAGFFYFQAFAAMRSLEGLISSNDPTIAERTDWEPAADGAITIHLKTHYERRPDVEQADRLMDRVGGSLSRIHLMAFACELVIKAISLTCQGCFKKSHNLEVLYCDLPKESRLRMEDDWSEIFDVIKDESERFGAWRYLDQKIDDGGVFSGLKPSRAQRLGKAVRILLDEAEAVGLSWKIKAEIKLNETKGAGKHNITEKADISVVVGESPPRRQ